ncbi:MAG TPA: hypothetical protein PK324_11325, partial [Nocardioides sp.]|nr:hypothetical protein [Nocardioides sp.]
MITTSMVASCGASIPAPFAIPPIDQPLPFTVNFENSSSSSRHVNEVHVVAQLDADLDPYTFQLGDIRIGDI